MKTSLKMIYPAKILYATFFTATLVTICTLQAMENPYKDGKQTAQTQKIITLHCSDTTEFKVRYEIVIQSKTIMDAIGNLDSTRISIPIADSISSTTMKTMIYWMEFVTHAQAKGCPTREIILKLMTTISDSLSYQSVQDYKDYVTAASYLEFGLFLQALCLLVAQNFNDVSRMAECFNNVSNEVYDCLQRAYYFSHHKQLDIDKPVEIALDDLATHGLISDDALIFKNNVEKFIIHLNTTFQYQTLQSTLDILSKYSNSLSIKAHEVLVAHVRLLKHDGIKKLFDTLTLQGESTLKMALRLVYAKDHNKNLDNLDCVNFFQDINYWLNGAGFTKTMLLSQPYLQYVLPLIEPVTKTLIRELNLSWCKLTCLPESFGNLVNLTQLSLFNNNLTSLPESFGNLSNLTTLNLSWCKLTCLPESFGNLSTLEYLDLSTNQVTSLPDSIGNLVNLTRLDLAANKLASLPDAIGNLVNLTSLDLYNNQLTSLPDSIGNLVNVKKLHLGDNKLTSLPDSIGNLSNLTELRLKDNKLTNETKRQLKQKFKRLYDGLII